MHFRQLPSYVDLMTSYNWRPDTLCVSFYIRNKLTNSIKRQNKTHCLHCSSWLNTGSFPEATASCNGVLKKKRKEKRQKTKHTFLKSPPPLQISQKSINQELHDLPALAVLHVGVGSGFEQSLCDPCHAAHHLHRVFLWAERTDKVQWGFHRPNCRCVHLSRVANQEDGGEFIAWKERKKKKTVIKREKVNLVDLLLSMH